MAGQDQKVSIQLRTTKKVRDHYKELAKKEDRSMNYMLDKQLKDGVERDQKEKVPS